MKWFKHMSDSRQDERIASMINTLGYEGYGVYWALMEMAAGLMGDGKSGKICLPLKNSGGIFGFSQKKFEKILKVLKKFEIFSIEFSENCITIEAPNLLELQDEYTQRKAKKSGQCRDKLPTVDIEEDIEEKRRDLHHSSTCINTQYDARAREDETPDAVPDAGTPTPDEQNADAPKAVEAPMPVEQTGHTPSAASNSPPIILPEPVPESPPETMPAPVPDSAPPVPEILVPRQYEYRQPSIDFDQFWDAYPVNHGGARPDAEQVWAALRARRQLPGLPKILNALTEWQDSENWAEQGGRWIPSAANFLRKAYWNRTPRARPEPGELQPAGWNTGRLPRATTVHQQQIQDRDLMARFILETQRRHTHDANDTNDTDESQDDTGYAPVRAEPDSPELPGYSDIPRAAAGSGRDVGGGFGRIFV